MTISEIVRRSARDRKTSRAHLNGEPVAAVRQRRERDPFDAFGDYARARLTEDPDLWAQD